MWGWIIVIVLYVLGMAFFHLLGGLGAAAEALQRWGSASSTSRRRPTAGAVRKLGGGFSAWRRV
jgi:hypothetical protein